MEPSCIDKAYMGIDYGKTNIVGYMGGKDQIEKIRLLSHYKE